MNHPEAPDVDGKVLVGHAQEWTPMQREAAQALWAALEGIKGTFGTASVRLQRGGSVINIDVRKGVTFSAKDL